MSIIRLTRYAGAREREKYLFSFTQEVHLKFTNLILNTAVLTQVKKDLRSTQVKNKFLGPKILCAKFGVSKFKIHQPTSSTKFTVGIS